jgi:hypothetical protein
MCNMGHGRCLSVSHEILKSISEYRSFGIMVYEMPGHEEWYRQVIFVYLF